MLHYAVVFSIIALILMSARAAIDYFAVAPLREIIMKNFSILVALLLAGALVGCNTIQGAGKDIERGGEKLQDSAKSAREKM